MTEPTDQRTDPPLVLVVDDDPELRGLVSDILAGSGFRTIAAADGEDAIAFAENQRPSLIVLDIMMRGMDGYTALTQLKSRASTRDIPVIVLTGQDEDIYRILSIGGGAVAHLTKPFSPSVLTQTARRFLGPGGS